MTALADMESRPAESAETRLEPDFKGNALTVLSKRYLIKNDQGEPIETPAQLVQRVASNVARAELNYPGGQARCAELSQRYYELMASCEFLPNSPTLMNAGKGSPQQLSACFVIPVEDAIDSIFDAVKHAAIIHKTGGGTGFSFSRLRPKNDRVRSTKGVSSGPVSFMRVFNAATEAIKQGGARRGANMGILRVDHPDIQEFIHCKADMTSVTNFNISVAVTEKFMDAVEKGEDYELVNPKTGKVVGKANAREVFNQMVDNAWNNGDPGIVFIDRINRDNPTPKLGSMESTNPCGEQPLLPYEACNLGSVNLAKMLKRVDAPSNEITIDGYTSRNLLRDGTAWIIDWSKLGEVVRLSIRFLDDVIDQSDFPLEQIADIVKNGNRKVGLGVMGFADMLFMLGIAYNTPEAAAVGEAIMSFIQTRAVEASRVLASERGAFGNYQGSVFTDPKHTWYSEAARRNATVTTIAPTGTISIIANCSSGIEPLFAISFHRKVLDGAELVEVHPYFEEVARTRGFYTPALMREIAMRGSCQEVSDVPEDVRGVFITSHDISPKWHLEHQAAFQRFTENAVSKTVNFPNSASREDVADVYMLAYHKGCKGVTIYRDGSRSVQVLNVGTGTKKTEALAGSSEHAVQESHGAAKIAQVKPAPVAQPVPEPPKPAGLVLSAGGARIRIGAGAAEPSKPLRRRYQVSDETESIDRLVSAPALFITDGNGLRIPLHLVEQEGASRKGLQILIETDTARAAASTAPKCPECKTPMQMLEGCMTCPGCGFSKCG